MQSDIQDIETMAFSSIFPQFLFKMQSDIQDIETSGICILCFFRVQNAVRYSGHRNGSLVRFPGLASVFKMQSDIQDIETASGSFDYC